ncbi:hypothetical protein FDJ32_gp60 [Pseudomonas phage NV1]|uniref:Uncharacterized protein n=1 Tax=Pseudomonas phage NV1 TaxID=2079543 RepID=A0A2L0HPQ7_9CAUD|nr:hypothetical protein FDJ32_gp60 [Pseudomonas phage NV1]AUX83689.1 hypothetical protein NV1_p60 [Pseudomonas phage NV1]
MEDKLGYSMVLTEAVEQQVRSEILPELFRLVKSEIEGEWQATLPSDTEKRESVYHELHALSRVQLRVQAILDSITMKGFMNGR